MRFLLLTLALLCAPVSAFACECTKDAFTPQASRENIAAAKYIVAGRTIGLEKNPDTPSDNTDQNRLPPQPSKNPAFSKLTVDVQKLFRGKKNRKTLTVYADTGTSCGAAPDQLAKTTLFIVREVKGDLVLADQCGYYLTDEDRDALVRGDFMKSVPPLPLPPPVKAAPEPHAAAPEETASPASWEDGIEPLDKKVEPAPVTVVAPDRERQELGIEVSPPETEQAPPEQEQAPPPENTQEPKPPAALQEPAPEIKITQEETAAQPVPVETTATPSVAVTSAPATEQGAAPLAITLGFYRNGQSFPAPEEALRDLTPRFDKMVRGCWLFQGERTEDDWTAATNGPYIMLDYPFPVESAELSGVTGQAFGARVVFSQAVFSVPAGGSVISAPLVRHGDEIYQISKCDGNVFLIAQCRPELDPFFDPGYKNSCDVVEKWKLK
ncbi:MAG: hypothetical protein KDI61_03415 [Alphaproteobacteria bacterium]|nr:hypothetical protein [Alphaproteobacteria bacterium]